METCNDLIECFKKLARCDGDGTSPNYKEIHEDGLKALITIIRTYTPTKKVVDEDKEFKEEILPYIEKIVNNLSVYISDKETAKSLVLMTTKNKVSFM